jgi:hypothetical protein
MRTSNQYHLARNNLARFVLSALLLAGCAPVLNPFLPTAYENPNITETVLAMTETLVFTPTPTETVAPTETATPIVEVYDWNFVSQRTDEEIFNVIGIPNPADYSLNVELTPAKILRNEGGQSYALFQNSEGIVLLAENLETGVIEHAVYAEYEGGVPVMILTDASVVEHDGGWFQLNADYPASEAEDRFAEAVNRGMAMRWWAVNHPEDGEMPYGVKNWLSEIPGYQAMEFDSLTRGERGYINDYILQTFITNLQSSRENGESVPVELTDRNRTEFDATRDTLVINTVIRGDRNWQIILNHTADSYHQFLTTERSENLLTVFLSQPAFMPTRIPSYPVGGNITDFLRYFFGSEYYLSNTDMSDLRVNETDMTGPILESMCASGSIPESLLRYSSRVYVTNDWTHTSTPTNSCAVTFGP